MRRVMSLVAAAALMAALPSTIMRAEQSSTAHAAAETPTPAGTWTMNLDTPHGSFAMTFELTVNGDKVGGTLTSDATGVAPITGTFTDGKIAMTADVAQGIEFHFTFKDKDTLTGNLSSQMGDMAVQAVRVVKKD